MHHCEAAGHTQPIHKMYCIIHQEAMCAKSANLVDVMSVVVKVVNSILSRSLNHRQFQALVDEVDGDLLYFCEVRWLSRGAMLSRVCDLQKEIATFLRQKNLPYADQFFDPRWLARLALLTDIITHLNALNVNLQGKDILVTDKHAHMTHHRLRGKAANVGDAIGLALLLVYRMTWSRTLALVSSPLWGMNLPPVSQESGRWLRTSSCLPTPLTFPWTTPLPLQMELVELQCNDELKAKFYNSSPLSFFRDIALPSRKIVLNTLRMFNAS